MLSLKKPFIQHPGPNFSKSEVGLERENGKWKEYEINIINLWDVLQSFGVVQWNKMCFSFSFPFVAFFVLFCFVLVFQKFSGWTQREIRKKWMFYKGLIREFAGWKTPHCRFYRFSCAQRRAVWCIYEIFDDVKCCINSGFLFLFKSLINRWLSKNSQFLFLDLCFRATINSVAVIPQKSVSIHLTWTIGKKIKHIGCFSPVIQLEVFRVLLQKLWGIQHHLGALAVCNKKNKTRESKGVKMTRHFYRA